MKNESVVCPRCNGEMRIDDYENGDIYNDDGKMPCPDCYGEGVIDNESAEEINKIKRLNNERNNCSCFV